MSRAFTHPLNLEKTSRDLVIRPRSLRDGLRGQYGPGPLWVPLTVIGVLTHALLALAALTDGFLVGLIVALAFYAVIAAHVGWYALFRRTNRLELRNDQVIRHTLLHRHAFPAASIVAAKRVSMGYYKTSVERAFLLDTTGRAVVRWTNPWWPKGEIDQLLAALDVYFDGYEYLSAYRCNKRWPGSAAFYERHVYLTAFLFAIVGLILIGLGIAVFAP